jgi:hypothetical protein
VEIVAGSARLIQMRNDVPIVVADYDQVAVQRTTVRIVSATVVMQYVTQNSAAYFAPL